jgi:hypothetical protein
MNLGTAYRAASIRYVPGRLSVIGVVALSAAGWLLVFGALVGTISVLPEIGWGRSVCVVMLCGTQQPAIWMTGRLMAARRMRSAMPSALLERRHHGNLDAVTDSERRPLRPIGTTMVEIAERTSLLLTKLIAIPSVRIFYDVRSESQNGLRTTHAICAGRTLVLIESVAWPPGHYRTDEQGRVHCDGIYIGQSVSALLAAVGYWRKALPRRHRVSAMIVVHGTPDSAVTLPATTPGDLTWSLAENAVRDIRQCVPGGRHTVRRDLVAALIKATTSQKSTA